MPQASGWALLGDALGGDSEKSYQEGLALGARTQDALAQARERVSKAQAQANLASQLEAAGLDPNIARASATALTAGGGLGDVLTMLGKDQERHFRDIAGSADPNVDTSARQRALAGVASGPIKPFEAVGSHGYADIMHPELGVQAMPSGAGDSSGDATPIQVLRAFGFIDPATGRVVPGKEQQAFDVMRTTQRIIDMGGVPGAINANPFSGSQSGLGDALAPPTGTAPPVAPAGPAPATAAPPAAARPAPAGAGGRGVTPLASAGTVAANAAEIAKAKQLAGNQADQVAQLPSVSVASADFEKQVQDFIKDPGFSSIYGRFAGTDTGQGLVGLASQEAANAQTRLGQLKGQTFIQSIQKMRGLGQLSNQEGVKVETAFTRAINTRQDPQAAQAAWNEVISSTRRLRLAMAAQAYGHVYQSAEAAQAAGLQPGTPMAIMNPDGSFTVGTWE
jgi:hypothetical protein